MSKNTIFGEEHFIDRQMIKLVEQRNNTIDNYVFEQMENTIKGTLFIDLPKVEIDKEKLKKWVLFCMKLENIEHSELVDVATKKKIADLEAKLAESEKELKLANKLLSELLLSYEKLKDNNEQLKQQLAEKDAELKKYNEYFESFACNTFEDFEDFLGTFPLNPHEEQTLIRDLKNDLAEKEKENNELVFIIEEIEQFAWEQLNNENFDKYKAYDEMLTKIRQLTKQSPCEKEHQDKISFAVEQLEKVKEKINDCPITDYDTNKHFVKMYQSDAIRQLDNQIKQLKEMNNA